MRVLILGVTGMLGSALFRQLDEFDVYGTCRSFSKSAFFQKLVADRAGKIISNVDVLSDQSLEQVLDKVRPNVVINCVGIIKQKSEGTDAIASITINSLLPHKLTKLAEARNFRLIHFSTDCVFSGAQGQYKESDFADAHDLYGRSKFLGEVSNSKNVVTLRTSIIGHELDSNYSLINWFLSQKETVQGYQKAIYSGLPTTEMASVLAKYVIPKPDVFGLFHLSTQAISKFDLLQLVKIHYKKNIQITQNVEFKIDRSLNSDHFRNLTGYVPPQWPELVFKMNQFAVKEGLYVQR